MAHPRLLAVVELLKPITWFPPMWAFCCGVVASGQPAHAHWALIASGVLLVGPLVCATSQAANDWFDREVDAINEPHRPIPSGRLPGRSGLTVAILWTMASLVVAAWLGTWVLAAAAGGLLLAWLYSAPPVRLKKNGWWGNSACALCYEGLAWATGTAVMLGGTMPGSQSLLLAFLYTLGAHGIMTLNDFKSIEGDQRMGIGSLPVRLGVKRATQVACASMVVPQLGVVVLLALWQLPGYALSVAALVGVQLWLMRRLMARPRELAPWYNGTGIVLYVAGMMISASALHHAVTQISS